MGSFKYFEVLWTVVLERSWRRSNCASRVPCMSNKFYFALRSMSAGRSAQTNQNFLNLNIFISLSPFLQVLLARLKSISY